MATGSTEPAFPNSSPSLQCFNSNLLKADHNKYWNEAQVLATASTESFWEDDPEEKVKKIVMSCKSKFHLGRALQIKHLPRDVTEAELKEALSDFPVLSVHITSGSGSSVARVELEDPEMLEDWDSDRTFLIRGQCVPVTPTATELMLCVARLPLNFTDNQFKTLVESCGEVSISFLMHSEKTGESKGYGFVVYKTSETALHAKNLLDRKDINGFTLVCDWLESKITKLADLHSKCLYVDRLPKNFRDMSEFRRIFSTVANPPYCQIALKHGCPQDWGLVEYDNSSQAEAVFTSLNGYNLRGENIRISYYIPGVRALHLFLKLLHDPDPVGRSTGLLPEPTNQDIVHNLHNLFKQNPIFAQNLQSIITSQMQAAFNGDLPPDKQKKGLPQTDTIQDNGRNSLYSPNSGLRTSPPNHPPPPPLPKNGYHPPPPPPGPSPPQFLKPPPPNKIPLLPNPTLGPPPPRRLSLSPPAEVVPSLPTSAPPPGTLEEDPSATYWASLLGHLQGAPPTPISFSVPPPESPYSLPPPNFIRETPNMPLEVHQSLISLLSNPQNIQQMTNILTGLHTLGQTTSATPSPVPPPNFNYPMSHMQGAVDPSWALATSVAQPMPHLARPLLTSPIPIPMSPKPVNFLEVKPPPHHMFPAWGPHFVPSSPQMFSPFGSPGIIWSQASPMVSPQPNPIITPIGQKRRILPSPESSPEGNYIGQHSQGIGGHYADSYFKRKKTN